MTKPKTKCPGPGCTNPAGNVGKNGCCSDRCRLNYNAEQCRRKKGIQSRADSLKELGTRKCKQCGKKFPPTTFGNEYCSIECRANAAKIVRQGKKDESDGREQLLSLLDYHVVDGADLDYSTFQWITKEDFYQTDKRSSDTKALIAEANKYLERQGTMSLRHLFYHLVSTGMIANSLRDYQSLTRKMTEARERGDVPVDAFEDRLRESITYASYVSPKAFKETVAYRYKADLWKNQDKLIEVWIEKDSVVSVLEDAVREYRVPLRILRGQGSTGYLYSIAEELHGVTKPIHIFYAGDHDPAGYTIEDSARHRFHRFLMDEFEWTPQVIAEQIRWKRIAFLPEDFEAHNITALEDDVDKKKLQGLDRFVSKFHPELEQWESGDKEEKQEWGLRVCDSIRKAELEALPPEELQERVRNSIKDNLNIEQRNTDVVEEERVQQEINSQLGVNND